MAISESIYNVDVFNSYQSLSCIETEEIIDSELADVSGLKSGNDVKNRSQSSAPGVALHRSLKSIDTNSEIPAPHQGIVPSFCSSLHATQGTENENQVNGDFDESLEPRNSHSTESTAGSNGNNSPCTDNLEKSMSEQDIRDVLFEAGYPTEAIDNIVASKAENCRGDTSHSSFQTDTDSELILGSAFDMLKEVRIKNVNNIIIGTLNINSLAPKLDQLSEVIGKNIDILTIQETKLDSSFPTGQLALAGYSEPYRLDRNRDGGGVLIYVREDIPSKLLTKHNFTKDVEGLFIEINLRKSKLLFFGGYRSEHEVYGLSKNDFFRTG